MHAIKSRRFAGIQFHAESILTENGCDILDELLSELIDAGAR